MSHAFEEVFGIPGAFHGAQMAGRTDSWIVSDALAAHGIAADDARVSGYPDVYLKHLARELPTPAPGKFHGLMPGIVPLLDALAARPHIYLALLTGNYEPAARMKLEHFDLWKYFACGAFGDAAPDRNGLLSRAIARVAQCGGPAVVPSQVVIVGDTPLDVAVAIAGGARSIGVATGSSSLAELQAAGADVVFPDLSEMERVLAAIDRLGRESD
jgi:phosphoglycolate phosphatase